MVQQSTQLDQKQSIPHNKGHYHNLLQLSIQEYPINKNDCNFIRLTPPTPPAQQHNLPPEHDGQNNRRAVHHAGDAEEGLDDRVPDGHGPGLDLPGALGEEEQVEIHEEDAGHGREGAEEKLGQEDPAPDARMGAHHLEEASCGRVEEVGLGNQRRWTVD
jgi:hypothetical protein